MDTNIFFSLKDKKVSLLLNCCITTVLQLDSFLYFYNQRQSVNYIFYISTNFTLQSKEVNVSQISLTLKVMKISTRRLFVLTK